MKFRFPRRVFPALGLVLLISGLIASVVAVLRSTELRRRATETENRLVGEWKFDEGTGETVADSSGNDNNGTWNGTGSHWTDGKFSKAGSFNGTDDSVKVSDSSNLHSDNFSITAWFKKNSGTGHILAKEYGPSGDDSYAIWFPEGNKISAHTSGGRGGVEYASVTDGQWYHVAFTKSGINTGLFIDGIQISTASSASVTTSFDDSSIFIGADDNDNNEIADGLFNGVIDQVRIYDYALTPEQIVADMQAPTPTPTPTPIPPGPITCRDGFSDNFDGESLDATNWETATNNNGTAVQNQGQVTITNPAADGIKFTRFNSKNKVSGDFVAELDIKSLTTAGNQRNGSLELSLTDYETEGFLNGFLRISRYADGYLQSFSKLSNQASISGNAIAISPTHPVKVKIERKGAVARTYYDVGDGQGYRPHTVFQNAFSGDGTLEIFALNHENFPEVTAAVDNFSLKCPPPAGSLDEDGDVDIFDYNLLLEHFDERKQLIFQDNFDAPAIDEEKWDHNQIIQTSGVLTTTIPAEVADTGGYISSKQRLSGNFQIETDMKNFLAKENDPGFATTSELKMWYNDSNAFMLRWVKDGGGSYIDYINQLDGVWNDGPNNPIPNISSLTARLIRNGNTMTGFIDAGNGMTEMFSVPNVYTDSGNAQVILWKAFQASPFEAKAEFDNFSAWSNPPSIGDIDLDGDVDIFDYNLLLEHFGGRS